MDESRCPKCNSDSLATVLSMDDSGERMLRSYCPACGRPAARRDRAALLSVAGLLPKVLVYGGIVLAVLTATADYLAISGRTGFGWRQMLGAELGFLAIAIGLLLRQGLLGVAGMFLLVLSIGADLLHVGQVPGYGWRSSLGFIVATAMLVGGVLWRRALARRALSLGGQ
jgi:hypothetical protein